MRAFLMIIIMILSSYGYGQTVDLSIQVSNIKELKGNMSIAIFNSPDGFPSSDSYFVGKRIPVRSKDFVYVFENLPVGKYAVAIYHDVNKNGKLDKNWFGIPKEAYGFSYIKKGKTGSAKFEEALFDLKKSTILNIRLIH